MKNIYIAGRITGLPYSEAFERFSAVETGLKNSGFNPLNPMNMVDQRPGRHYNEYLLDALKILVTQANGIYMLDNWRDSKGARIEHAIAELIGIEIFYAATPFLLTTSAKAKAA